MNWLLAHKTKVLGFAQITVGFLATSGVFGDGWVKWFTFFSGLLTVWVGFLNSQKAK
jgi:hypothetical protein